MTQQPQAEFPQMESGLVAPTFQQGEDLIECINKAMTFLSDVASKFPSSNNQLRMSSNLRNHATIHDGRVTVQHVQGRQNSEGRAYGETVHSAKEAKECCMIEDLDAYGSDCDDLSSAKAVLMEIFQAVILMSSLRTMVMISVIDDEETLILKEESRSKMLDKQNDPISIEKKINISPIDYSKLNNIKEDFVEAPHELPKVSLVNKSLKKLRYQLAKFNKVVKNRTTSDAITAGAWGFEHTKACFQNEIIPFIKVLKDTFNAFDKTLLDEITEVQSMFNQMEAVIDQCFVDKNDFEIQIKQLRIDNDQLLNQIMSQEIMHIAVNSVDILDVNKSSVNECCKCLELETELLKNKNFIEKESMHIAVNSDDILDVNKSSVNECCKCLELETELFKNKDFIEKDVFDKLVKSYSTLEKHCISLELATQINQEIFQKENSGANQNAPTFNQLFKINELKAQSQEKDTVIMKLKEKIKSLSGKANAENVKMDIDEMETINIELEHSVAKLLSKNEKLRKEQEHLKSIYKDQFDSIKKTRVRSKEHSDSLIAEINAKSVANSDLNAQLQEKVFAIAALKNELRKLKGKSVVDTAISKPFAVTIAPGMFKINLESLAPKLLKNKDAHIDYIKHTHKNADILRELVKKARALSPLDSNLDSACKYVQRNQEVLVYVKKTCPCLSKPSEKLVAVTPLNKDKRVRFADLITSSSNVPKQTNSLKSQDSNKPLLHSI
ncbi:hypothetical protein Tco_0150748 [Tanacetum coccineum]